MTRNEKNEFRQYLRQCTDAQVQGVYDKERAAGRREEAKLAIEEADRRGMDLAYGNWRS